MKPRLPFFLAFLGALLGVCFAATTPLSNPTVPSGNTLTVASGATANFASGSTVGIFGTNVTSKSGTGSFVLSTSPTLTTPNLGTPSVLTLTNATGLPLTTGVTGTLPLANGGTGATTAVGVRGNLDLVPSSAGHLIYVTQSTTATDTRTGLSAYDPAKPFATLGAAKSAASSGDTILVGPGSYSITASLAKNGVNWWFSPGASVMRSDDNAEGIWDDGGSAMQFTVDGAGDFTQRNFVGFNAINCSHADSVIVIRVRNLTSHADGDGNVNLINSSAGKLFVSFNEALCDDGGAGGGGDNHGVWWLNGEMHVEGKRLYCPTGGYYGVGGSVSATPTGDGFVNIDEIVSDQAPIYTTSGTDTAAALWVRTQVAKNVGASGLGVVASGNNRLYVTAQKIFGTVACNGSGSPLFYLESDKVSAVANGTNGGENLLQIALAGAVARITVRHWDVNGHTGDTMTVSAGSVELRGGDLVAGTAKGMIISGGTSRAQGLRIDTSGSSSQNPVTKSGGTLVLDGCTLVAEGTRDSITSGTAQNVKVYNGTVTNRAKNANITIQVGSLTVDSNVQ